MIEMRALSSRFGVEIADIDLDTVTIGPVFDAIRAAFDTHSALLFRDQNLSPDGHQRLARLFGPLEDRKADEKPAGAAFDIPQVSNIQADGSVAAEADLATQSLKANQLWHTDSTFLPVPALSNILVARILPDRGGETALASTRAAWADMPEEMRAPLRHARLWHRFAHSQRQISEELARRADIVKWPDQCWPAIWRNPVNGWDALYIASHAYRIEGMDEGEGQDLIRRAIEFCTRPDYVYTHHWQPGDVLIWDERATLHRGLPWPYAQARRLDSICSSATDADGLAAMRR